MCVCAILTKPPDTRSAVRRTCAVNVIMGITKLKIKYDDEFAKLYARQRCYGEDRR